MNFINPKIKDVLKENENTTVLGLFWAGYWRFACLMFLVWIGIFILAALVASV
jgi:hypothetical protein